MKPMIAFVALVLVAVSAASAGTVAANFNSSADVPITLASYTAAGDQIELSISFAPTNGTSLLVVNNTGLDFITGEFINLAHGQVISLTHDGLPYQFVANYYGGTGNDLVLEWFRRDLNAWGSGSNGRLGNGGTAPSKVPVDVLATGLLSGKTVTSVSAGDQHSLALCSDGTLAAWGSNASGQLGNSFLSDSSVPIAVGSSGVLAGKDVIAVSAGGVHSLALCSDGTVVSWGGNSNGQLGDGTYISRVVPVNLIQTGLLAGKKVVAISAGNQHSLALCSDGQVVAWGRNFAGILGTGSTGGSQTQPVAVDRTGVLLGKTVVAVSAGEYHNLVLCSDGTLVTWGYNDAGMLGIGNTLDQAFPVAVISTGALAGKFVTAIDTGSRHNLVLCSDGTLLTWGSNFAGQLGNGQFDGQTTTPMKVNQSGVLGNKTVTKVAAGSYYNLVSCSDGTVASWGWDGAGHVGNGSGAASNIPVLLNFWGSPATREIVFLSVGTLHSVVIGSIPFSSKLSGLGLSPGILTPALSRDVQNYVVSMSGPLSEVVVTPKGDSPFSTIQVNGSTVASGSSSQPITLSPTNNTFSIVVVSENGSSTSSYTVTALTDITANCLSETDVPLTTDGYHATGWQINMSLGYAPTGNLTVINNTSPSFIQGRFTNLAQGQVLDLPFGGKNYRFVANYYGGTGNDLVLEWPHRRVVSWGSNSSGQLGNGETTRSLVPVSVIHSGVLAGKTVLYTVSCHSACHALCSDGTVVGWGYGGAGALGHGSFSNSSVPVVVSGLGALVGKKVIYIAAGNNTVVAICSDGTIATWGDGTKGQLGNGTKVSSNIPVAVRMSSFQGRTPVAAAVGGFHCIVLCSDGAAFGWGENQYGQVGDGSASSGGATVPVRVSLGSGLQMNKLVAVGAGLHNSLGLYADGTVTAWGRNQNGEQGAGLSSGSINPVPRAVDTAGILAGKTVARISTNGTTCLAWCSDGTVAWWGNVSHGLNTTTGSGKSFLPIAVDFGGVMAGRELVGIGQGDLVNFAIFGDGTAAGWGENYLGQVGDGSTTYRTTPVMLEGAGELYKKRILSISGGGQHAHAILAEPESGYISWMAGRPGVANKTEFADSEFDGIPNLIEYVLNGNPAASSTAILPTVSEDGSAFVFAFDRLALSEDDTIQIFQTSTDMIRWTDIRVSPPAASEVELGAVDGNGNQSVTVTIPKGDSAQMFGRLSVGLP
ncbi:MAG: cadherin-like beta sandwich domain-containing protein [Luteolibacter sp.]